LEEQHDPKPSEVRRWMFKLVNACAGSAAQSPCTRASWPHLWIQVERPHTLKPPGSGAVTPTGGQTAPDLRDATIILAL
jgi:hypothetical protein